MKKDWGSAFLAVSHTPTLTNLFTKTAILKISQSKTAYNGPHTNQKNEFNRGEDRQRRFLGELDSNKLACQKCSNAQKICLKGCSSRLRMFLSFLRSSGLDPTCKEQCASVFMRDFLHN
jgi:hypothetical protein